MAKRSSRSAAATESDDSARDEQLSSRAELLEERILDAVASIPAGFVMSYGDVAEYVGIKSGRQVGRVMSQRGSEVCWHRVVRADGTLAPPVAQEQAQRLREEGVPFTASGRVELSRARWDGRARR